jgi:hypothetical protein
MNPIDFGQGDLIEKFGPEDVLAYVYAVLNSPSYRDRYESFLEKDFARIQVTRSAHLFRALCKLGHQLIRLHVMESTGPNRPAFPVAGENEVAKPRWTPPEGKTPGRVWINRTQYFEGVPRAVWEFRVGGYQVCEKWLKDRKGRTLSHDELEHYRRVAAALARTIELMAEIDQAIEAHGGWPIDKGDGPAQPPLPRGSAAPPAAEAPAPTEKPRRPAPESTPSKAAPRRAR